MWNQIQSPAHGKLPSGTGQSGFHQQLYERNPHKLQNARATHPCQSPYKQTGMNVENKWAKADDQVLREAANSGTYSPYQLGRNIFPDADVTQTRHSVPETLMYDDLQMEYNIKVAQRVGSEKAGKERCLYVIRQLAGKFQSSEDKASRRMTDNEQNKDKQDKVDSRSDIIPSTAQKKDPQSLKFVVISPNTQRKDPLKPTAKKANTRKNQRAGLGHDTRTATRDTMQWKLGKVVKLLPLRAGVDIKDFPTTATKFIKFENLTKTNQ